MKNSLHSQPPDGPEIFPMNGLNRASLSLLQEILDEGSVVRIKATGRSMEPFLRSGEIIFIKKTPSHSLRIGDLILFRNSFEMPVLHRVIRNRRRTDSFCFLVKGDALESPDGEIPGEKIMGKVIKIEKHGPSGNIQHICMDSFYSRSVNLLIGVSGLIKIKSYFPFLRLIRKYKKTIL